MSGAGLKHKPQSEAPERWLWGSTAVPKLPYGNELELATHLAAVEYSLANAIVIRDRDDIQSTRHWSERLEPFEHQIRNLITFCRRAPVAMIADEVGLGKTISAGLILSELMTREKVSRTLVVCPSILMPQWQSELKQKFGIRSLYASGRELLQHLNGNSPVVITTYHTARDRMEEIKNAHFDMAILDEAHKLKSLHGQRVPAKMATEMHNALSSNVFRYVLMLTATPIQNSPWDIYSLIDLLTTAQKHRNPLGDPKEFQAKYLDSKRRLGPARLKPGTLKSFRHIISQYVVRASRTTTRLPFPDRHVVQERAGNVTSSTKPELLLAKVIQGQNPLQQTSLAEAMMSSHTAFYHQVKRMQERPGGRLLPDDLMKEIADLAKRNPLGPKFAKLRKLIEAARSADSDFRVVVFTKRLATQEALVQAIESMGIPTGIIAGGRPQGNLKAVSDFTAKKPLINVIVSTDAGAEGVNLQAANLLVNYDLPWNPMIIEQRIGRIQRLGSQYESVKIVNLVVAGSIEERIVARLISKLMQVTNALGEMEPILEAAALEGEDGKAFESKMRQLVLEALNRKDPDESLRAIEEDINAAKEVYERNEAVVRETLGAHLSDMHTAGPQLPDLEPVVPRMSVREFVANAYRADGATVTEEADGALLIDKAGEPPFRAVFDPSDARLLVVGDFLRRAGANVRLYQPGAPAFEQLVGEWAARSVHQTFDLRSVAAEAAADLARSWVTSLDPGIAVQHNHVSSDDKAEFRGELNVRASVGVAHDRLDRLVTIPVGAPLEAAADDAVPTLSSPLDISDYVPSSKELVEHSIAKDSDLSGFADFYQKRLDEEVARADGAERVKIAQQNFTPQFSARLQGARGTLTSSSKVSVEFTVDGYGPFACEVRVTAGGQLEPAAVSQCAASGRTLPVVALVNCEYSDEPALEHLLVESQLSGRNVLPQHVRECEVTGARLSTDEVTVCALSGMTVNNELLQECAVSGESAIPEFMQQCTFTGALALPDNLSLSEVSGRTYRIDEEARCAISGKVGHRSEFELCGETRDLVLDEHLTICDISGLRVREDLLVTTDKAPHRRVLRRFVRRCAVTGRVLLLEDGAESAVSGRWADRSLLARSAISGVLAFPDELVHCAVTGQQLLPRETDVCTDTNQRVDRTLLRNNDLRGGLMLTTQMQQCPESGVWGRSQDLARCEATGQLVDPRLLTECTESLQRILKRLTVECAECGRQLLRDLATRTAHADPAHPGCTQQCLWTDKIMLRKQTGQCAVTGVFLDSEFVTETGEAHPIASVRARSRIGQMPDNEPQIWQLLSQLGYRPRRFWQTTSLQGRIAAVCVQESQFLGLMSTFSTFFVDLEQGRVVGRVWR